MRVLLVEDDLLISMGLEMLLTDLGHDVVGQAQSVESALEMVDQIQPDMVLLDHHLKDGSSELVAQKLIEQAIPFVWTTGRSAADFDAKQAPVLAKPFRASDLRAAIDRFAA